MKLLRYLIDSELSVSVSEKQPNGVYIKSLKNLGNYKVQKQNLTDEISASIYGADINKMLKISTPLGNLEKLLLDKVDNEEDNISLYFITINNTRYKIKSVTDDSITIERL